MKRQIRKEEVILKIKLLDTRLKNISAETMDTIIDNGFAEILALIQPFTNEIIEPLDSHYELGENRFQINIDDDVSDIYDLYLTKEDADKAMFPNGVIKFRDKSLIWRDDQRNDIVHIDLTYNKLMTKYDNAVVKYFYEPNSQFTELSVESALYVALDTAFSIAAYDMLNDVERAEFKRGQLANRVKNIANKYPNDFDELKRDRIFPYGV